MNITDVRIKLMNHSGERLLAFCSIAIDDCFLIRDIKIVDRENGPFVAMPSRTVTARCARCGYKNRLSAGFCNQCGGGLKPPAVGDGESRPKLYSDVAHPIKQECRDAISQAVLAAFRMERERSQLPDYVCSYADFDDDIARGRRREVRTKSSSRTPAQ